MTVMSARRDIPVESVVSEYSSSVSDSTEEVKNQATSRGEEWTARDTASVRLQLLGRVLCFRNKPRIRWIRSKGAILVLLWNCLVLNSNVIIGLAIPEVLQLNTLHDEGKIFLLVSLIRALSLMLLYPLAGWIADVYFGRYRVIKVSLWLMWTGTVITSISLCINVLLSPDPRWVHSATQVVLVPMVLVMEFGRAGFLANAIPFGIDHLSSGSGDQLSGFITWFVFTQYLNLGVIPFPFSCPLLASSSDNTLFWLLLQTALLSVALILDSFCRHWLATEPHTSNPFKLVARVLKYARKNKQPQFRSAFTYQEDIKPSRIEYAKSSYGGPFTTEQVEDVKTFLRIVSVLIPMGALIILSVYTIQMATLFSEHINSSSLSCYAYQAISVHFPVFIIMCTIFMYEFFIHPILYNYIPSMLTRVGIGFILIALSYVTFFSIDLVGHRTESHEQDGSMNYTCLFDESSPQHQLNLNPLWTLLPGFLSGLAGALVTIAVYEFVFSQSPYNMKGLLMGAIFATEGTFQLLGLAVQFPFYLGYMNYMTVFPTCGSVYTLLLLALSIVWFVVYVLVARGYHKRKREETKRQQDYAEDYYSKYIPWEHQSISVSKRSTLIPVYQRPLLSCLLHCYTHY